MSIFDVVCSKLRFSRTTVKMPVYRCIVLRAGLTGTRNQKMRSRTDSFRRHERIGDLRILKRASIRNYIFRGKLTWLDFREISITYYPGLDFGNRAYPWTCVDE